MLLEKKSSAEQIRDERGAEDPASGTVLDFLWDVQGAQDPAPGDQARHAPPPDDGAAPGPREQGAGQDRPSGDELKDVLERYASWLSSWSGHD